MLATASEHGQIGQLGQDQGIYQSNSESMAELMGQMSQYPSTYQSDPGSLTGQVGQMGQMGQMGLEMGQYPRTYQSQGSSITVHTVLRACHRMLVDLTECAHMHDVRGRDYSRMCWLGGYFRE